jgi:hypothetical protein
VIEPVDTVTERFPLHATAASNEASDDRATTATSFNAAMLVAIGFRSLIFVIGVISVYTASRALNPDNATGFPWIAWDGNHYLSLARHGYALNRTDPRFSLIAFFPMLPMVAHALAWVMSPQVALVLTANVCAIIGFGFFYSWSKQLVGARVAMLAVLFVSTYPGAVFFCAGLTEGPFFMLVALSLWMLQREKYWPAAIVAAIATAPRPTGVALALLVPLYYFVNHPTLPFPKRAAMFVCLGFVSCLGGMLYQGFIWNRYKMFDAYIHAQQEWEDGDRAMVQQEAAEGMQRYSLRFFLDRAGRPQAWNRIVALAIVVVTAVGLFKPGPIPRLFFLVPMMIFLMTYLPNNGLRSSSIIRYETAGVPIYLLVSIWLSQMQKRGVLITVLSIQLLMQMYYAFLFSRGSWVG